MEMCTDARVNGCKRVFSVDAEEGRFARDDSCLCVCVCVRVCARMVCVFLDVRVRTCVRVREL